MTPVGAGEGGGGWLEGEVCILRSPGISASPISDANFPDQNVQRHSVTSLETVRSLANDPSWSVGGGGVLAEGEVCILRSPGISASPIFDANFPDQNVQRHSVTSLETMRSLANDPSWSGARWLREKYVFCVPREFQRLLYLMQIFPTRMCNVTA